MLIARHQPTCSSVSTMDSPLFYELPDQLDSLKNNNSQVRATLAQHRQHQLRLNFEQQQQQQQGFNEVGRNGGLAPIRLPQSGAVFGNGHLHHNPEGTYTELADINTPEISLDLQVFINPFKIKSRIVKFFIYFKRV